jgi:hypothetical protein
MLYAFGRLRKYWPLFIVHIIHVLAEAKEWTNVEMEIQLH